VPPVHTGMLSFRVVQVGQIRRSKWANLDERTQKYVSIVEFGTPMAVLEKL
jgi:hypothetical protein